MLEAARAALSFVSGHQREDLAGNQVLAFAVVRCLEIVGEAAARITPSTKARFNTIPWVDIVGMRNWLIHAYFDINYDRVWDTVADDLPPLIAALERVLPEAAE